MRFLDYVETDVNLRGKPVSPTALLPPPLPPPQDADDCDVVSVRFAVVIAAAAGCAKFTLQSDGWRTGRGATHLQARRP